MNDSSSETTNEFLLTASDLQRAAVQGVLSIDDSERLIEWAREQYGDRGTLPRVPAEVEHSKGFNLVTIAYYFGAMLMISACAWFLGDKWDVLGSPGILATAGIYFVISVSLGWWLRGKGYIVGGGLLITVAVCLVPLITYTIQDMLGLWPAQGPGEYAGFYPWIHGSWIVIELATIAAALIALRFIGFGFLTAPLAFSFWFFSMDVAALILGEESLNRNSRAWISAAVGLVTMVVGYGLDRSLHKQGVPRSQDFAFWCYLFGLMAFWGGLTSMNSDSEVNKALYALLNVGLIGIALKLKRAVFLVFGAIGIHLYLGHLAYAVFKDSFLFPFALAFLGLSLILVTVLAQRHLNSISEESFQSNR